MARGDKWEPDDIFRVVDSLFQRNRPLHDVWVREARRRYCDEPALEEQDILHIVEQILKFITRARSRILFGGGGGVVIASNLIITDLEAADRWANDLAGAMRAHIEEEQQGGTV